MKIEGKMKYAKNLFRNKKGVSMEMGLIIAFAIIILLIIVVYMFLGDAGSGLRELIRNIFG